MKCRAALESTSAVVKKIALSKGVLLIMFVAPFLWGLLPLGYAYIKHDACINDNPTFIVAMRMWCAFIVMSVLGLLVYPLCARLNGISCRTYFSSIGNYLPWKIIRVLIALGACYFGARLFEMKWILGFDYAKGEMAQRYDARFSDMRSEHPCYDIVPKCFLDSVSDNNSFAMRCADDCVALGADGAHAFQNPILVSPYCVWGRFAWENTVCDFGKMAAQSKTRMVDASNSAIREFGYFMGLLLSLLLPGLMYLAGSVGEKLFFCLAWKKGECFCSNLKGEVPTFVGTLSLIITTFLVVASGALNLAAREPLYAWESIGLMLMLAVIVSIFTGGTSICKTNGTPGTKTRSGHDDLKDHGMFKAFVSAMITNGGMALVAAVIASIFWLGGIDVPEGESSSVMGQFAILGPLGKSFFRNGNTWPFLGIVVVLGSVVAPMAQLLGVQLHDRALRSRCLTAYGIKGGDWLRICGGCEPFFVVLIGIVVSAIPCLKAYQGAAHPFVNYWPIAISVLTVFVIILLRVMETWAEKNSTLRNYVYTRIRGSSRGVSDRRDSETNAAWQHRLNDDYNIQLRREKEKRNQTFAPVSFTGGSNAFAEYIGGLETRAFELAVLKLYDKWRRLDMYPLQVVQCEMPKDVESQPALDAWAKNIGALRTNLAQGASPAAVLAHCAFVVFEGCDAFFTQDDPYSHDALGAMIDWLSVDQLSKGNNVYINSFSYEFRPYCNGTWSNLKFSACRDAENRKRGTPFVIIVRDDVAKLDAIVSDVLKTWNEMLDAIHELVRTGRMDQCANAVMMREMRHFQEEKAKDDHKPSGNAQKNGFVKRIKAWAFAWARITKIVSGLLVHCFFSKEFLLMIAVLGVSFLIGWGYVEAACGWRWVRLDDSMRGSTALWSILHMFDLSSVIGTMKTADGWTKLPPLALYLATWLMGGGILLGVVIGRGGEYLQKVRDGLLRYTCALEGHYVFLGWEPNAIAQLQKMFGRDLVGRWSCERFCRPRVVILANRSAIEIRKQIEIAFRGEASTSTIWKKLPFSLVIYNGEYTDPAEFEGLRIRLANCVYLTGELEEEGHDSHVLVLVGLLNAHLNPNGSGCELKVRSRIASPIFHHQLAQLQINCGALDNRFFNFHVNWARAVWDDAGRASIAGTFDLICGDKPATLIVVGMGRFGLALVERAMEIAHKWTPGLATRSASATSQQCIDVLVVDPDASKRESQFKASYAEDIRTCSGFSHVIPLPVPAQQQVPSQARCDIGFLPTRVETDIFKTEFEKLLSRGGDIVVAVTMSRPHKALETAFNVNRMLQDYRAAHNCAKGPKVTVLVRQNVDASNVEEYRIMPSKHFGLDHLYFFGFQNGAGYGVV